MARDSNGLLDLPRARRWFELLDWGSRNDLYTFQQPLEGRSGPRVQIGGQPFLMLSSYDYLGLIGHPALEAAAIDAVKMFGTGTGGVRLLTGTTELHRRLEHELASFKGTEAALVLGSGYAANLAVIPALVGPGDVVLADEFVHRSVIDACRLAQVTMKRFRHNDLDSLASEIADSSTAHRKLIVAEGVYSMEGDVCPLPGLIELRNRHGAFLMVDEAHALGTIGSRGRGIDEFFGVPPSSVDIWTGSLSKALGSQGGFVAASSRVITYLQHESAAFVFSAALCPGAVAAARAALQVLIEEPGRLEISRENSKRLRDGLRRLGYSILDSPSAIVPLMIGEETSTYLMSRQLFSLGVLATAVTYPAVPRRQGRLRLCATAAQSETDLDEALEAIRSVGSL